MSLKNTTIWQSIFRDGKPKGYNALLHLHPRTISRERLKFTSTFCMGGMAFFMLLVLTVSGVLLMFFYVPDDQLPYGKDVLI